MKELTRAVAGTAATATMLVAAVSVAVSAFGTTSVHADWTADSVDGVVNATQSQGGRDTFAMSSAFIAFSRARTLASAILFATSAAFTASLAAFSAASFISFSM